MYATRFRRDAGEEGKFVPAGAVLFDVAIKIGSSDAPVVKPVTPFLNHLLINGWRIVVRRDEFDHHVAGETHGDSDIGLRRSPAIFLRLRPQSVRARTTARP